MSKKTPSKKTKKTLIAEVLNIEGKVVDSLPLPEAIFHTKINTVLLAQAVRVYLANQRSGTHSTKTRSSVVGSTRKIYRQKGTGRARHGDRKAPIFIGGGIAHGPKPTDYSLHFPQKMKLRALLSSLTYKFESGHTLFIRGIEDIGPKTKQVAQMLKNLKLDDRKSTKKSVLLVLSENRKKVSQAGRNIPFLTVRNAAQLNTYEMLTHKKVLFEEKAVEVLKKTMAKTVTEKDGTERKNAPEKEPVEVVIPVKKQTKEKNLKSQKSNIKAMSKTSKVKKI